MKTNCNSNSLQLCTTLLGMIVCCGCMAQPAKPPRIPAVEYSRRMKQQTVSPAFAATANQAAFSSPVSSSALATSPLSTMASMRSPSFTTVAEDSAHIPTVRFAADQQPQEPQDNSGKGFSEYRSQQVNERDYNGPLALGDPGLTASLWRESSGGNDMFRDQRAFAPMDLITIVVSESTKATGKADTETKEASDVSASIPNLLGIESSLNKTNPQVNLSALITAAATNNFKGEGTTNRQGNLTAKISGVVVEVLPGGLLRIEGEKIIAVNSEEQNLVITGLVRTRDVNSKNEVDSSKVANLRIDYFGNGVVGEAQNGGWLSRIMRRVWPF